MFRLRSLQRVFALTVVLFLIVIFLVPQQGFAQMDRCCVVGPGSCYPLNPDLALCPYPPGGNIRLGSCDTHNICSQSPQTRIQCCLC